MEKIFEFHVSSMAHGRHHKFGVSKLVHFSNGSFLKEDILDYSVVFDQKKIEEIDYLEIAILEEPHRTKTRPWPDFLQIDIGRIVGISKTAEDFLRANNISFESKEIKIINETEHVYKLVKFPKRDLIDLERSYLELDNDGEARTIGETTYFPDSKSRPIVINSKRLPINGIEHANHLNLQICSKEVASKLQKAKLTGFDIKQMEVSK